MNDLNSFKQIVADDNLNIDKEIAKATFQIAVKEWIASKESDKKKKAEILLQVETLKDMRKKNETYKLMITQFMAEQEAIPTPFK